jgi:hypothetical protein
VQRTLNKSSSSWQLSTISLFTIIYVMLDFCKGTNSKIVIIFKIKQCNFSSALWDDTGLLNLIVIMVIEFPYSTKYEFHLFLSNISRGHHSIHQCVLPTFVHDIEMIETLAVEDLTLTFIDWISPPAQIQLRGLSHNVESHLFILALVLRTPTFTVVQFGITHNS